MSAWRMIEIGLYALLNVAPYALLALLPFRSALRFPRGVTWGLFALLCALHVAAGLLVVVTHRNVEITLACLALYAAFYLGGVRAAPGKLVFALILVVNYAHFVVSAAKYLALLVSPRAGEIPYGIYESLCMLLLLGATMPFCVHFMRRRLEPVLRAEEHRRLWRFLWFLPAVFYLCYLYCFSVGGVFAAGTVSAANLVFILLITPASFGGYYLVVKMLTVLGQAHRLEREAQLMALERRQYQLLQVHLEEVRRMRHDMRQHLRVMGELLTRGEHESLEAYLAHCAQPLEEPLGLYCEHPAANAIIGYYLEEARRTRIQVRTALHIPKDIPVEDADLCIVLGNLLENAVTACGRVPDPDKRILTLNCAVIGRQMLTITLENSRVEETPKGRPEAGHGIGLASVRSIAAKYAGTAEFIPAPGRFTARVILNPQGRRPGES